LTFTFFAGGADAELSHVRVGEAGELVAAGERLVRAGVVELTDGRAVVDDVAAMTGSSLMYSSCPVSKMRGLSAARVAMLDYS
jgi:hypothetical protein